MTASGTGHSIGGRVTAAPRAGSPAASTATGRQESAASTMTVGEFVGRALARLGVGHAFGVVGSGNFAMSNALRAEGVPFVAARHEGGAATMADAYARVSGDVAVLSVHQGCGLTNATTGIGEAAKSRTPLIVLAAEASPSDVRSNFRMDQPALAESVGAVAERVHSAASAAADVVRAFRAARERRTVVLNVPLDVQAQRVPADLLNGVRPPERAAHPVPSEAELVEVAGLLRVAERPVIIAGRGARGAREEILALARTAGALVATSAVAKGLFQGEPFDLGISGGFSTPLAAELIQDADLVLALGCSLTDWTTRRGGLLAKDATLIQVDDTPQALGAHRKVHREVLGDVEATAVALTRRLAQVQSEREGYRTEEVRAALDERGTWARTPVEEFVEDGRVDPRLLTGALDAVLPDERVVCVDSGNFMGYPSQYLSVPDERGFCFTQAFQSIGLGLGTAIGAALASPGRLPVLGTGDGGFLMGVSELETAVRLGLPLLVVIYDDAAYGAEVHHFGPADPSADLGAVRFPDADLAAIARGFGARGEVVRKVDDLAAVAAWLEEGPTGPLVLDVKIASDGGAWWLQEAFARH